MFATDPEKRIWLPHPCYQLSHLKVAQSLASCQLNWKITQPKGLVQAGSTTFGQSSGWRRTDATHTNKKDRAEYLHLLYAKFTEHSEVSVTQQHHALSAVAKMHQRPYPQSMVTQSILLVT